MSESNRKLNRMLRSAQSHAVRGNVMSAQHLLDRANGFARGIRTYSLEIGKFTDEIVWSRRLEWILACQSVLSNEIIGGRI